MVIFGRIIWGMADSFKVIFDNDSSLGYETHGPLRKLVDLVLTPVLNSLPTSFSRFIKKSSAPAGHVLDHRTTHKALETLYHHGRTHQDRGLADKIFRFFCI